MSKFINVITYLIGFLFIFNGFLWLINPSNIASSLGMALLSDHGLSTQTVSYTHLTLPTIFRV